VTVLVFFGILTAVGTAILTVTAVAKLLVSPLTSAIGRLETAVQNLDARHEASDAEHQKDIKDVWRHLAEKK